MSEHVSGSCDGGSAIDEALALEEYRPLVRKIASRYFLPGADRDDVEQEALVGLWKAVRDFNGEGSFKAFAALVIERQLITALKTAQRLKHRPLTHASRRATNDEGEDVQKLDFVPDPGPSVVDIVAAREELGRLSDRVRDLNLSALERHSFFGLVNGETYAEMAAALGVTTKSIDNAIARARRKVAGPFEERRAA